MSRPARLALALTLCSFASACVLNPLTQERDVVLVSLEEEIRLGEEVAEQVEAEMGLVEDEALLALVRDVGERVAAVAPQQGYSYRFKVVDRVEPNAFALPGGHVYVSRGLLAITNTEDELANALAHEIVHVAARHHAQRQATATGVGILALPGLLVGGLIGGPVGGLVSAPFALVGVGAVASYSRSQELEADEIGQRLAGDAGYAPSALAEVLRQLERDEALRSAEARQPTWFDSHPSTPRRVAKAAEREVAATPASRDPGEYLARLDGLRVGANPAEGVFDGQRFLHPALDFTLVFPEGWKVSNRRDAVGAYLENGGAQVALEFDAGGKDAREAANAFIANLREKTRVDVARIEKVERAGAPSVRAQLLADSRRGRVAVDATWILHGEHVYRLTGVVQDDYSDAHRTLFGEVGESFATLTGTQRAGIGDRRLRLRKARAGESLAAFSKRTGNAWTAEETAAANALLPDAVLAAGQVLKVALREPYRP